MKLNDKLYNLRKKNGYTQAELAEKLGVSRQSVSNWELGAIQPSTFRLKKISELYSVPLEVLIDDTVSVQPHLESTEDRKTESISSSEENNQKNRQIKKIVVATVLGLILIFTVVIATYNIAAANFESEKEQTQLEELENEEVTIFPENGFDFQ